MKSLRDLLVSLGVSHVNATIVINTMNYNPAGTDPGSVPTTLLVQHMQRTLAQLGAPVAVTGQIDQQTNSAMESLLPGWLYQPWTNAVKALVRFRDSGGSFKVGPASVSIAPMSGLPLGLPDVPGGLLTYLAAAAVGWHFWNKR